MRWVLAAAIVVTVGAVLAAACAPDAHLVPDSAGSGGTGAPGGGAPGGAGGSTECPSAYTDIPQTECDIWRQDCSPPERCSILYQGVDDYGTICATPNGLASAGEPCVDGPDCEWGLECSFGTCSPTCCYESNHPCGPGGYCISSIAFESHFARFCAYLDSCELFAPGSCDGATPPGNCHIIEAYGQTACVPAPGSGANPPGGSCTGSNAGCDDDLVCFDSICRWLCYLDGSGTGAPGGGGCLPGETCHFAPSLNTDNIGICG